MTVADVAPFATLAVASVALFVGLRTVAQRDLADRREQWWVRYRWATDLTLSPDRHRREVGLEVLELLAASRLAGAEEVELLDVATTAELSRRPDLLDDRGIGGHDGDNDADWG